MESVPPSSPRAGPDGCRVGASGPRFVYCHCAHAGAARGEGRDEILERLVAAGVELHVEADLCGLAARRPEALSDLLGREEPTILVACYPRTVRWLLAAAGVDLRAQPTVINPREPSAPEELDSLLRETTGSHAPAPAGDASSSTDRAASGAGLEAEAEGGWTPWFPVIDRDRCTDCGQCLSFCLFDVFTSEGDGSVRVARPSNCKTGCPACSRVCPEVAIIFPKYDQAPINGAEVRPEHAGREKYKVDISGLLGGDPHAALRRRHADGERRFSAVRDEATALRERMRHLVRVGRELDVPPELLDELGGGEGLGRCPRRPASPDLVQPDSGTSPESPEGAEP